VVWTAGGVAQAQDGAALGRVEDTRTNAGTYHYFVPPGAATVRVEVLGAVRQTGLYEVGEGTDLGRLYALTGGILRLPDREGVEADAVLRLYRPDGSGRRLVHVDSLEYGTVRPPYPALADGDVVAVEVVTRRRFGWRDALQVVSAVGVVVLAVERLTRVL
jgi:hypothetical protein